MRQIHDAIALQPRSPVTVLPAHDAAIRFLTERINFERSRDMPYRSRELKLQRMEQLLERLGRPQDRLQIVHIAGTKGKGSTAATMSALLQAGGYRTGLFISPHIERLEERIQVNDQMCSPTELAELVDAVRPVVAAMDAIDERPTFFEVINSMAYLQFVRHAVDWVVMEVGLGGRLDSTNVCSPRLTMITSISFDHTKQLGNTLAAIAREKAGIIKPGVPVISGVTDSEPAAVIRQISRQRSAELFRLGQEIRLSYRPPAGERRVPEGGELDLAWSPATSMPPRSGLTLTLPGFHQASNAALAVAGFDLLHRDHPVPDSVLQQGLRLVRCPGRIEVLATQPLLLLDSAHNAASAQALAEVLAGLERRPRRHLLLTTTLGKDVQGILTALLPCFDRVVISCYSDNPRSYPPRRLFSEALSVANRLWPGGISGLEIGHGPVHVARPNDEPLEVLWHGTAESGWQDFTAATGPDDLACVTGSFFFVSEARRLLQQTRWGNSGA